MLTHKKEADRLTKIINFFLDVMKWNKHMTWVIGNMLTMQCYQAGFYYIWQSKSTKNTEGIYTYEKKKSPIIIQVRSALVDGLVQ